MTHILGETKALEAEATNLMPDELGLSDLIDPMCFASQIEELEGRCEKLQGEVDRLSAENLVFATEPRPSLLKG